jgi:hypothetical protein
MFWLIQIVMIFISNLRQIEIEFNHKKRKMQSIQSFKVLLFGQLFSISAGMTSARFSLYHYMRYYMSEDRLVYLIPL